MGQADFYDHGNWNFICDVCGFKFKASEGKKRWDGVYVCKKDFELRHPQQRIRGIKDTQKVEWTRPQHEPQFIDCVGKAPVEYQSHTQTSPKDNANYGSGISLSARAERAVTSSPSFNYNTDFDVGEANLQIRNSSYQGPPIVLPITETLIPSSLYGSFIFISEDGATIVSNAHGYDASNGGGLGALFIHKEVGGVWVQVATILSLDVDTDNGLFGFQMSISGDGNRILVTAPTMGAVNRGKAFMLDTTDGWATFTSAPAFALNLPNESRFGHNCWLASNGQTAFVGSLEPDASGAVYVFEQRDGMWSVLQKLTASDSAANAYFGAATTDLTVLDRLTGNSIASSSTGQHLIIGSPGAVVDGAPNQGVVYYFTRNGDSWTEAQIIPLPIEDRVNDTIFFGFSVGMSAKGNRIIVGEPRSFLIAGPGFTGKVAFYDLCSGAFEFMESTGAVNPQSLEFSGTCVAISPDGRFAASGAIQYDGTKSDQGRVLYYDFEFPFVAPPVIPIPPPPPPPPTLTYQQAVIADGPISYFRFGEQVQSYAPLISADGPISYWRLGESSGATSADEMGLQALSHVNTPSVGIPGLIAGDSNLAVSYIAASRQYSQSTNDQAEYSFTDGVNDSPFSLEAWINITDLSAQRVVFSKTADPNSIQNEYLFQVNTDGSLVVAVYGGVTADNHTWQTAAGIIEIGSNYHVVCTYGGSINTGLIYVNGSAISVSYGNTGSYTSMVDTVAGLKISSRFLLDGLERFMQGVIDEPAIYGFALTPTQIQAHYNAGSGGSAIDEIGLHDQAYVNAPTLGVAGLIAGDANTAVSFVAANKEFTIATADLAQYSFTDGANDLPFSLEAWINLTAVTDEYPIIGKNHTLLTAEYLLQVNPDGSLIATLYDQDTNNQHRTLTQAGLIVAGTTYHVVFTYDGTINSGLIYINGVSQAVTNPAVGSYVQMRDTIEKLHIGARFIAEVAGEKYFDGVIDEPAIYDKVITPEQILTHYTIGTTP